MPPRALPATPCQETESLPQTARLTEWLLPASKKHARWQETGGKPLAMVFMDTPVSKVSPADHRAQETSAANRFPDV
jgi:hypothetical protein